MYVHIQLTLQHSVFAHADIYLHEIISRKNEKFMQITRISRKRRTKSVEVLTSRNKLLGILIGQVPNSWRNTETLMKSTQLIDCFLIYDSAKLINYVISHRKWDRVRIGLRSIDLNSFSHTCIANFTDGVYPSNVTLNFLLTRFHYCHVKFHWLLSIDIRMMTKQTGNVQRFY